MPFFSIIIPTYKRPDQLKNAVYSVLLQTYQNFEIIIVNDSPDDKSYSEFENNLRDSRIIYIKNEKNSGVNFSRNRALSSKSIKSDWVIFLDDDDTFNKETLKTFTNLINENKNEKWFICNRATNDGKSLTKINKDGVPLNYDWNFLILRKFSGDATHCLHKDVIRNVYFPKTVRQGDEWLFFYEIGTKTKFFYHNFNATLTDGYSDTGLNYRKRSTDEQLDALELLWKEGVERKINKKPTFIIYMLIRLLRAFIKN